MKTTNFLYLVLFSTLSFTLSAQWVKQTLPTTLGSPHMGYPGTNKNAFGKNFFANVTRNFDGNSTQVGNLEIVRTTDGGRTYRTSTLPLGLTTDYYALHVLDAKTSFLATTHIANNATAIYRTVDSGATWQVLPYQPQSFLNVAVFFDQNDGVAIFDQDSLGAFISYTSNGGTSFTRLPPTNVPRATSHEVISGGIHQVIGDAILQPTFDTETGKWRIWRSIDRGRNWTAGEWQEENSPFGPNLIFTDANNGFWVQGLAPPNFYSFYTINGGHTWQPSGALPGIISGGPMSYLPNTNNIVGIFEDQARLMLFSAITNDFGKTWNTKKDLAPYTPDSIYLTAFGLPTFGWSNLDIVDNNTAWARFSRTELYRYNSSTPIVPEKPDLDLTLTADTEGLPLWGHVKFTLTIKNRGISKATSIRAQWLPPYKRVSNGGEPFAHTGAYSSKGLYNAWTGAWSIDELGAGESATVNFHVFVLQNTINVSQSAQITACNELDLDSSPNNMTATSNEDDEARFTSVKRASLTTEPTDLALPKALVSTANVFPNPATNKVNIAYQLSESDDVTFTVTDVNGRIVFQKQTPSVKTGVETFEVSDWTKGVYLLRVAGAATGDIQVQKIVKE